MINTEDQKKKKPSVGAGFYSSASPVPNNDAIFESLAPVPNVTEQAVEEPAPPTPRLVLPPIVVKDNASNDQLSDSDNLEIAEDESDSASEPASPAPRHAPRAFEKSDSLYDKEGEPKPPEGEDWSWEGENVEQEGMPIPTTDSLYRP